MSVTRGLYGLTMNGRLHTELITGPEAPHDVLSTRLQLLDGIDRYSLSLWRLPEGTAFDRVDLTKWPQEYVQVAGSREAMTVELRRLENGIANHYVLDRATDQEQARLVLPWNAHEVLIYENEVFDSQEAALIFGSYFDGNGVPGNYQLRPLADERP